MQKALYSAPYRLKFMRLLHNDGVLFAKTEAIVVQNEAIDVFFAKNRQKM